MLEDIGESDGRSHLVSDDFENAAYNVALNRDDERCVVLSWYVEQ